MFNYSNAQIEQFIKDGIKLPLATQNYPSRGQTAIQELYQTSIGKLFLKRVSERNHKECQINVESGTLAEREYWAYRLAVELGLKIPVLWLLDRSTTVQVWLDLPDGHTYKKSTGKMTLKKENIFDCVLFDWITGQVDRHDANYLYNFMEDQIIPVDSAHSFLKYEGSLPDYLHLFEIGNSNELEKRIHTNALEIVKAISEKKLKSIVELRDELEFRALIARKERLSDARTIKYLLNLYRSNK